GDGDLPGDGDGDTPGDGDGDLPGDGDGDGDASGDGDGDLAGDGDGDGDTPMVPTFAACADQAEDLPERSGASINVIPAGPGRVTVDGNETTLRSVIAGAADGDSIVLGTGTYTFDEADAGSYT